VHKPGTTWPGLSPCRICPPFLTRMFSRAPQSALVWRRCLSCPSLTNSFTCRNCPGRHLPLPTACLSAYPGAGAGVSIHITGCSFPLNSRELCDHGIGDKSLFVLDGSAFCRRKEPRGNGIALACPGGVAKRKDQRFRGCRRMCGNRIAAPTV
jgi:hypothetical protein